MLSYKNTLLIALIIFIQACSQKDEEIMRVGMSIWPGYEPMSMGRELGYIDSTKLHLVEYSHMSQTVRYFRNGLIDAAALTLDQVLALSDAGEDISIILVMDVSNGADAIIAKPDIKDMSQLKSKHIGLENNVLGAYVLARALELSKMTIDNVSTHKLNIDEQEAVFNSGELDAVVTFDPVRARLVKAGNNVVFDTTQIPWEIVDVMVVRNSYMRNNPENVQYLVDVWFKSLEYFKHNPDKAAEIISERMKVDVGDIGGLYTGLLLPDRHENFQLVKGEPEPLLMNTARRVVSLMRKNGLVKHNVDPSLLFGSNILSYKESNK